MCAVRKFHGQNFHIFKPKINYKYSIGMSMLADLEVIDSEKMFALSCNVKFLTQISSNIQYITELNTYKNSADL